VLPSALSVVRSTDQIGCLDFSLLFGALFMSLYTGRSVALLIFYSTLVVVTCLRISGKIIFEKTGSVKR